MIPPVPDDVLVRACHIFLDLAYPGGPQTIPENKRAYYDMSGPVEAYLASGEKGQGVCQIVRDVEAEPSGYAFRLGSAHYPLLKLVVQYLVTRDGLKWVCMVDTHDTFSRQSTFPPEGHPDAEAWRQLQSANRELKEKIEKAFEESGLVTFHSLLRDDLGGQ